MRIGLTYDLASDYRFQPNSPPDAAAEFDDEEVIAAIEGALRANGHETIRIGGARALASYLTRGRVVDLVFNVAEGQGGRGREAQVPAILETFGVPYTGSDVTTLAVCLDKALTKWVWQAHDLPTAPFHVAERLADLNDVPPEMRSANLFVKPSLEGSSMGVGTHSIARGEAALHVAVQHTITTYRQPALIEPYLPGPEYTVAILGSGRDARALGCLEVTPAISDYRTKKSWSEATFQSVADKTLDATLRELALAAYRALQCRDVGRVDIRLDGAGQPMLLEINPLPGLRTGRSALPIMAERAGIGFTGLIKAIVDEASDRSHLTEHRPHRTPKEAS